MEEKEEGNQIADRVFYSNERECTGNRYSTVESTDESVSEWNERLIHFYSPRL